MLYSACMLFLAALSAQTDTGAPEAASPREYPAEFYGMVPRGTQTFEVRYSSGGSHQTIEAGIRLSTTPDATWVHTVEGIPPRRRIYLYPDTPWDPRSQAPVDVLYNDRVTITPKQKQLRDERLRKGWEDNGYKIEPTTKLPVRAETINLAERAREMESQLIAQSPVYAQAQAEVAVVADTTEAPPSQDFRKYWRHAAVVAAGLVLLGLVARFLIFPNAGWNSVP